MFLTPAVAEHHKLQKNKSQQIGGNKRPAANPQTRNIRQCNRRITRLFARAATCAQKHQKPPSKIARGQAKKIYLGGPNCTFWTCVCRNGNENRHFGRFQMRRRNLWVAVEAHSGSVKRSLRAGLAWKKRRNGSVASACGAKTGISRFGDHSGALPVQRGRNPCF